MRRSLPAAACISPAPCAYSSGSVVCGCRHRAFAAFLGDFLPPAAPAGLQVVPPVGISPCHDAPREAIDGDMVVFGICLDGVQGWQT